MSVKPLIVHMISDVPRGAYHHYCAQLCNGLVERGDVAEVRLINLFEDREHPGIDPAEMELLEQRVRLEVIGPAAPSKARRYLRFLKNLLQYVWRLWRAPPDVAHIQTPTGVPLIDLFLLGLYRSRGVRLVRTVHEATADERTRNPTARERWLGRWQLKLAHALIAHDASTRQRLLLELGKRPGQVAVIPIGNYLVFRKYMGDGKEDAGRRRDMLTVLFLGIKRHKGIEVFAQALRQLQQARYPIRAIIVGRINPGDEDVVEAIKQLPIAELAPGYIPNAELWRIYAESDVVVMPYLKGTTSATIQLAYAFKRPVIVSDLECFQDLVLEGKTGLVVPRGNSTALAEAIVRMYEHRAMCRDMGEEGFRLVSSAPYRWDTIAAQTVQVYRAAVNGT